MSQANESSRYLYPDAISTIISNGIIGSPKNWGNSMNPLPLNPSTLTELFSLLKQRQITYLLVGGIAMLNYIEGRNTQDIDFLMSLNSLTKLPELEVTSQDQNFARAIYGDGLQVDLLLSSNRVFEQVLSTPSLRATATFGQSAVPCATPEGLVMLKLYALPSLYGQGQFQRANLDESDLTALKIAFPEIDLRYWISQLESDLIASDLNSLNEISVEIETRAARLSNG